MGVPLRVWEHEKVQVAEEVKRSPKAWESAKAWKVKQV